MKFSKVASIAILALSAQAAIVQSNQEPTKAKKMSLPETLMVLLVLTFFLKENNYDALVKNDELSSILPILISAISAALPEIIKIVSGLLGNSSTASSTGSLNEQDVIGDIVDEVKKVLPQAISSVQQNAGNTKRDTTTELIQAIIQEGVKLTPEIISFLQKLLLKLLRYLPRKLLNFFKVPFNLLENKVRLNMGLIVFLFCSHNLLDICFETRY